MTVRYLAAAIYSHYSVLAGRLGLACQIKGQGDAA